MMEIDVDWGHYILALPPATPSIPSVDCKRMLKDYAIEFTLKDIIVLHPVFGSLLMVNLFGLALLFYHLSTLHLICFERDESVLIFAYYLCVRQVC